MSLRSSGLRDSIGAVPAAGPNTKAGTHAPPPLRPTLRAQGATTADAKDSNHFYLPDEMPIFAAPISRESSMIIVRALTASLVLLAAAPALAQDRRVPASAAEVRLS